MVMLSYVISSRFPVLTSSVCPFCPLLFPSLSFRHCSTLPCQDIGGLPLPTCLPYHVLYSGILFWPFSPLAVFLYVSWLFCIHKLSLSFLSHSKSPGSFILTSCLCPLCPILSAQIPPSSQAVFVLSVPF